jgi:hypothetical protein
MFTRRAVGSVADENARLRDENARFKARQAVALKAPDPTLGEMLAKFGFAALGAFSTLAADSRARLEVLPEPIQNEWADRGLLDGDGRRFRRSDEGLVPRVT